MADVLFKRGQKVNLPEVGQDNDTLYFTEDTGELYKSTGIGLPLMKYGGTNEETIVFVTTGNIPNGLQDASIKLPFKCKVKLFEVSYLTRDSEMIRTNIYKSTDYQNWSELFEVPLELMGGENHGELVPNNELILEKGEVLRLNVNALTQDNKNVSGNLVVTRM